MATSSQIRRIATNPTANLKFRSTGELPRLMRPDGPLVVLLRSIGPRDRAAIVGLTVDPRLGYLGSRVFRNAEQAYRWLCPCEEMLEGAPWPAEASRDKRFTGPLYLEDVLSSAASYPAGLAGRYPRLRRPDMPQRPEEDGDVHCEPERP